MGVRLFVVSLILLLMPTRTPAEKERIRKKQQRNRLVIQIGAAVIVAVIIFACEYAGVFKRIASSLRTEAEPTPEASDMRIEYLNSLGISGSVDNGSALIVGISNDDEPDAQLVVEGADGPVTVTYICEFTVSSSEGTGYSSLFPNVDRTKTNKQEAQEVITPLAEKLCGYIVPLCPDSDPSALAQKTENSLYSIYKREADKISFIFGAYTIELSFDPLNELLTVKASPAG